MQKRKTFREKITYSINGGTKKPILYDPNLKKFGGRGQSMSPEQAKSKSHQGMTEMANIEQILRFYTNSIEKTLSDLKTYCKLVPLTRVNSVYYNDDSNYIAKGYHDSEIEFKRKISNFQDKYNNIFQQKKTIKENINNAYWDPQKFKIEQIDYLLTKLSTLHKQTQMFEKQYK